MPENQTKALTIADLQRQINDLQAAILNRPTIAQIEAVTNTSIGQFGHNPELVTDERVKKIETTLTIVLEQLKELSE